MKVLNLDKVGVKEQRKLVLAGVEYVVTEMTVDNFIETTKIAERLAKEGEVSVAVQIEESVNMISRSIPGIDVKELGKLNLEQLQAIVAFVRGDEVDGVEKSADAEEGTDAGN